MDNERENILAVLVHRIPRGGLCGAGRRALESLARQRAARASGPYPQASPRHVRRRHRAPLVQLTPG